MCAPNKHDGAQPEQKGANRVPQAVGGTASPARRKLITNARWCIGFVSTVNFMVGRACPRSVRSKCRGGR
jgi:hypothetical protein